MDNEDATLLTLTDEERRKCAVLVVEPEGADRHGLRSALLTLGYRGVTDASDHVEGLKRFSERHISHVIFTAIDTNMPASEFLEKILALDSNVVAIASSREPNADDVFSLLQRGAKGFLKKPVTADNVEVAIGVATKGEPLSEAIFTAKDRNEAFANIMASRLDQVALAMSQAKRYDSAKREAPKKLESLRDSSNLAKTFADGGERALIDSMTEVCIDRGEGPATRLGRLRQRLHRDRKTGDKD